MVAPGAMLPKTGDASTTARETVEVDDMLIVVSTTTEGRLSLGGSNGSWTDEESVTLNTEQGHEDLPGVIVHEIGHSLDYTEVTVEGAREGTVQRFLSEDGWHFEGPEAVKANAGQPVPFQWIDEDGDRVEPGTQGATIDLGHPDVCTSVMAYCSGGEVETPRAMDIAWLKDMGHETNDRTTALDAEVYGYGSWGTYSAWGVGVARDLTGLDTDDDWLEATVDAFGVVPDTAPGDAEIAGTATWRGALLGVDTATDAFAPVTGDAALNIDLGTLDGTATFDRLSVHADGQTQAFRTPSLEYVVSADGNRFGDADARIEGAFHGPSHQEMAGVLNETENHNLLAGFGGVRDE